MKMHNRFHRLLSVLLSLAVLLSCMVWQGVGAAAGSIDFDFESNPNNYYKTTQSTATNNTVRSNLSATLETGLSFAKSGTGAMKLAYLQDTGASFGPAFRVVDEDDAANGFSPTAGTYYRVTFSYYAQSINSNVNLRVICRQQNWASSSETTFGDTVVDMAAITTADEPGRWITVSKVIYCAYYRMHLGMYAPGGGQEGTTVYIDDLTVTPVEDASGVVPITLDPNCDGATAVTDHAIAGEDYTPAALLRIGYRVDGWYTDAACTAAFDGRVTEATTLYAKWAAIGKISHPGVLDFESNAYHVGQSLNLSVGTAMVTDVYNHTADGCYALKIATSTVNQIAGNTRPQFNLTDAYGAPLRVKAGKNVKFSFWLYIPEGAALTNVRYWLTVTEETAGYSNQKDSEKVFETSSVQGQEGSWIRVTTSVNDLPRDGYLRLGICSSGSAANTFYIDDIHAVILSGDETVLDYENLASEPLDTIRRGTATVSTAQNHTVGGGRALELQGISWGGYSRNQLILTDPATMNPYTFKIGTYYTVSMWMYSSVSGFKPNIWLWGTDDASLAFNTAADKNDKTGFEYDGAVAAETADGLLTAGEWARVSFSFMATNGQHMLMGITNGAVQNGGYTYYIDDVVIEEAPAATLNFNANGGIFTEGTTLKVPACVGIALPDDIEAPTREGYQFTGWHWDAEANIAIGPTYLIDRTELTLYAGWRPWIGTCYHEHSCDTVCRICGEYGSHQNDGVWSFDATGHWYACAVCGLHIRGDVHSYTSACDGTCDSCGYDRGASHTMVTSYGANGHSVQCAVCGLTESFAPHSYTDAADDRCDDCGYIRYATGDIDLDGDVDEQDAVYLAYHLFFPEYYPVYRNADVDRSGRVDDEDALYLKHHLEAPAAYPLDAPPTPVVGQDDHQVALG